MNNAAVLALSEELENKARLLETLLEQNIHQIWHNPSVAAVDICIHIAHQWGMAPEDALPGNDWTVGVRGFPDSSALFLQCVKEVKHILQRLKGQVQKHSWNEVARQILICLTADFRLVLPTEAV